MIVTAIVSPSARPRPSIAAEMTPRRPNGSTAVRIISHRVAPRASAASLWVSGVWANTSRLIAVTIGRIMIAEDDAGEEDRARADPVSRRRAGSSRGCPEPVLHGASTGPRTAQAPEAVDDRRDGGQQVDEVRRRRASRRGAYWVRNSATPTATGTAITMATNEARPPWSSSRSTMPNCSRRGRRRPVPRGQEVRPRCRAAAGRPA